MQIIEFCFLLHFTQCSNLFRGCTKKATSEGLILFDVLVETFPKITTCWSYAGMIQEWCHAVWVWTDICRDKEKKKKGQSLVPAAVFSEMFLYGDWKQEELWKHLQRVLALKM